MEYKVLNNGLKMPMVGLGVYNISDGETQRVVENAVSVGYPAILEENTKVLGEIFGYSETLYVYNTYQFSDYSRYDFNAFSEEDKRKYRDEHYDIDLKNAYELGKRLVQKVQL